MGADTLPAELKGWCSGRVGIKMLLLCSFFWKSYLLQQKVKVSNIHLYGAFYSFTWIKPTLNKSYTINHSGKSCVSVQISEFKLVALLSLQYFLLLFAESQQMEIREAHIHLQDKPFAVFQLSFYEKKKKNKKNIRRLESCSSMIIYHNIHEAFIQSHQSFCLIQSSLCPGGVLSYQVISHPTGRKRNVPQRIPQKNKFCCFIHSSKICSIISFSEIKTMLHC